MARNPKKIKNNGVILYNKILKEFTKVNSQLPKERQLSVQQRRDYVSENLYPQYKGTHPRRVGVKAINVSVFQLLETIPPKEGCDVNYISPSVYAEVGWFDIDDFISNVLPKCIYIRVDAGDLGTTKIFNTLNYDYTRSGVRKIYENIREALENGSNAYFTGVKKLKRGKPNDGTAENYFIDFILIFDDVPVKSIDPIIYKVPKGEKPKVTSVRNAILSRLKALKNKKKRRKNARKTAIKNIREVRDIKKRQSKAKTEKYKKKLATDKIIQYNKAIKQMENAFNKGNLTPEQYERFINEINNLIADAKREGGIL